MIAHLNELLDRLKDLAPKRAAIVWAGDEEIIEMAADAAERGLIYPILIGDESEIRRLLPEMLACEIIPASTPEEAAKLGVALIRERKADLLMKGLLDTSVILKQVVNSESGIKASPVLSHVAAIDYPNYDRILLITDAAMNITPTAKQKIDIVKNAVSVAHKLGYERPKVGLVSAVEKVNPKMQSTLDARAVVEAHLDGRITGCIVDGPFAIDNLVSAHSAERKKISSPVAGKADILVFNAIESGNVFYKTSVFLGGATPAGMVVGAQCPIVLTSRADEPISKIYSIALAVACSE